MLRLFTTVLLFLFVSLSSAQNHFVFRVGTVTYNGEGVAPSVGTFAVYNGDPALLTVTAPTGKPLFDVPSPLSKVDFWGSSPKRPLLGTYQAVLEDKTTFKASLDPDALLSPVENLSVAYKANTLDIAWTPLGEAQTYEVILREEGKAGDVLARRKVQERSVTFSITLEPSGYVVVVRAFNYPTDVSPLPPTNLAVSEALHSLSIK